MAANKHTRILKRGYWSGCAPPPSPEYVPMIHVYVMACEGRAKVGIAANVEKRLQRIAAHCPFPVKKVFSRKVFAHVASDIEHDAHRALAATHTHSEWFNCPAEAAIEAVISAMKAHAKTPAPEGWVLPPNGVPGPRLDDINEAIVTRLRRAFVAPDRHQRVVGRAES